MRRLMTITVTAELDLDEVECREQHEEALLRDIAHNVSKHLKAPRYSIKPTIKYSEPLPVFQFTDHPAVNELRAAVIAWIEASVPYPTRYTHPSTEQERGRILAVLNFSDDLLADMTSPVEARLAKAIHECRAYLKAPGSKGL